MTMALSNSEKVRRYRERQKAKKQDELRKPTANTDLFRTPFFEFFTMDEQIGSQYVQSLELGGIHPVLFEDDSGPETPTLDDIPNEPDGSEHSVFGDSKGSSLGKAEVLISCLLSSVEDLASQVNRYKKTELRKRIAEIEAQDQTEPEAKRAAFAKMRELTEMLEDLDKELRWPIQVWKPNTRSDS